MISNMSADANYSLIGGAMKKIWMWLHQSDDPLIIIWAFMWFFAFVVE